MYIYVCVRYICVYYVYKYITYQAVYYLDRIIAMNFIIIYIIYIICITCVYIYMCRCYLCVLLYCQIVCIYNIRCPQAETCQRKCWELQKKDFLMSACAVG